MIDPTTKAGARALERLEREQILWLTTVNPAGQPQASPVWFLWVDDEILLYSRAATPRLANLRANPRVAANFDADADADGDDVVSFEGEARIVREQATVAGVPPAYVEKYAQRLAAYGWTMESMLVDYPVEIRVCPTRVRAWWAPCPGLRAARPPRPRRGPAPRPPRYRARACGRPAAEARQAPGCRSTRRGPRILLRSAANPSRPRLPRSGPSWSMTL